MANLITWLRNKRAAGNNNIIKVFKITVSGSYAQGGAIGVPGETLNFNTAALASSYPARPRIPSGPPAARLPDNTQIEVTRSPEGYNMQIEQNASAPTPANFARRIYSSSGSELGSGSYNAGLAADPTGFIVEITVPQKYA